MELTGKIKAKIHAGTFDGVPKDTTVTIFIPGMKTPLKAILDDIEIEGGVQYTPKEFSGPIPWGSNAWVVKNIEASSIVAPGIDTAPNEHFYDLVAGTFGPASTEVSGEATLTALKKVIPGLSDIHTACPACSPDAPIVWTDGVSWTDGTTALTSVIMHLNDHHRWTRGMIADFLESKDWDLQFVTPEGETA